MVELDISELFSRAGCLFTDFRELDGAIRHLINGHVRVVLEALESLEFSLAHHCLIFFPLSRSIFFLGGSDFFIHRFLTLLVDKLEFQGVEQSLLVRGQLSDLGKARCVANLLRLRCDNFKVDSNEVERVTLLLNELEEVLLFLFVQFLGVLEHDELELDNGFELGEVGTTHILIRLVHEAEAVLPAVKVDLIGICPLFDLVTKMSALVLSTFELFLFNDELFIFGPGEHGFVLPDQHVVSEVVSSAPPLLVRNVF